MDFIEFVKNFKKNIDYSNTGMILFHNGVVRGTSRKGKKITKIKVKKNEKKINEIVKEIKNLKGISKVDVYVFEGEFSIGDDLMYAAVAGDIRENVFFAIEKLINTIKKEGVFKEEIT